MVQVFDHDPAAQRRAARRCCDEPSALRRVPAPTSPGAGTPCPPTLLDRDWTQADTFNAELVAVFAAVYAAPDEHWGVYETCEELVDLEDNFQLWRFRHLQVVRADHRPQDAAPAGRSGVDFLRRALDLTFFPELYAVRTEIGVTVP